MKEQLGALGLDIGCGESKRSGKIGLDLRKIGTVDVLADARMLPFKEGVFNHVFSSHVLEHFAISEVSGVLVEWTRVLAPGGAIEIRCPDLRARAFLFFLNPTWDNIRNIYGGQDYVEDYHKCGFSFGLLKSLLESCGIGNVKRIVKGYKGVPFVPDCLHVIGVKSEKGN